MTESAPPVKLAEWTVDATVPERALAMRRAAKGTGETTTRVAQSVLLAAAGLFSIVSYALAEKKEGSQLVVGVVALALMAVLLVLPYFRSVSFAKLQAEDMPTIPVRLYETGFGFGDDPAVRPLEDCEPRLFPDMAVLRRADTVVCLPRRVIPEADWTALAALLSAERDA
jgi:hypothetical protein